MRELSCDWCFLSISMEENRRFEGLCTDCGSYKQHKQPSKTKTQIVTGCNNYLECGNDAVSNVGDGTMCHSCFYKDIFPKEEDIVLTKEQVEKAKIKIKRGLANSLKIEYNDGRR